MLLKGGFIHTVSVSSGNSDWRLVWKCIPPPHLFMQGITKEATRYRCQHHWEDDCHIFWSVTMHDLLKKIWNLWISLFIKLFRGYIYSLYW